jgi:hypothetical protein
MTNAEINNLTERAAISAVDAHGLDHVPPASVAYDFIRNMDYELEEEVLLIGTSRRPSGVLLSGTKITRFSQSRFSMRTR